MQTCLAIDQGTHASRALLFDRHGNTLARATQDVDIIRFSDGRVEQDADQLLASVEAVVERVTAGPHAPPSACGIATQRSTVLAIDAAGRPLGPALGWQDVRGAAQVEALRDREQDIRRLTGLPLSPHYGASKLRWLLDRYTAGGEPPRLAPLASFLVLRLLRNHPWRVDHGNAQRTQLMDIHRLDWSPRLADWFGVPVRHLPRCAPVLDDWGGLDSTGTPVTAVCGDQNAALYSNGAAATDTVLVNLGSGAFLLRSLGTEPRPSRCQLTGVACSDARQAEYLREATVNGAGSALDWAARTWHIDDLPVQLPAWLEQVRQPPVFVNAVGGLAAPWWRADLACHFLDGGERAPLQARAVAVVESIAFLVQANLALMAQEAPLARLRVGGGLSRLDGLCQRLANLSGLPVERLDDPEATARGVAWLAAGRPAGWAGELPPDAVFEPQPDAGLDRRYRRLYDYLQEMPPP